MNDRRRFLKSFAFLSPLAMLVPSADIPVFHSASNPESLKVTPESMAMRDELEAAMDRQMAIGGITTIKLNRIKGRELL